MKTYWLRLAAAFFVASLLQFSITATAWAVSPGVTICHKSKTTLTLPAPAANSHIARHNDTLGPCQATLPRDLLVCSFEGAFSTFGDGAILRFDTETGSFIEVFAVAPPGESGLSFRPSSMALGPDGSVYVGAGFGLERLFKLDGVTGEHVLELEFTDDLSNPTDMTFGSDGNLYVTSFGLSLPTPDGAVLRWDPVSGSYLGAFVLPGAGDLDTAHALRFGPDGHLYVADRFNDLIKRYDGATGDFIGDFALLPACGTSERSNGPTGLEFRPDGYLYVLDQGCNRVVRFNAETGHLFDTLVQRNAMPAPWNMTFGPDANVYITTQFENSVVRADGATGVVDLDAFVAAGDGGLRFPTCLVFRGPGAG